MGAFIISSRSNGEFQYRLRAGNHETTLCGEGYTSKAGCRNGIDSVHQNSQEDSRFNRQTASNGEY